ncbi:hypothetical protein V3C99_019123 [Haemonchus contortus]
MGFTTVTPMNDGSLVGRNGKYETVTSLVREQVRRSYVAIRFGNLFAYPSVKTDASPVRSSYGERNLWHLLRHRYHQEFFRFNWNRNKIAWNSSINVFHDICPN